MIASPFTLKVGNTIIFKCGEYRNNDIQEFDGNVQFISYKGVDVLYASGYNSRHDFISFCDIIAKVDKRKRWVKLENANYSGYFVEFDTVTKGNTHENQT